MNSPPPPAVDRSRLPPAGVDPPYRLPEFHRSALPGGGRVRAAEHRRAPVVTFLLLLPAGSAADPAAAPGLAGLTADLLDEGTVDRSGVELHRALLRIGGRLDTEVSSDASIVGLTTLSRHARDGLRLLIEVAACPRFDPADVARVRDLRLNRIRQLRRSAGAVADRVFLETLYRSHPYGHPALGTEAGLKAAGPDDVAAFHRRRLLSPPWTLVAVGDVPPEELLADAERACADAAAGGVGGTSGDRTPDAAPPPVRDRMVFVPRAGAVQSEIRLGHAGPPRSAPDYHAACVLNMILGGQFVSRVNLNLRETKGYTYGARTSFDWRVGPGPFRLQAGVQTSATADAVREAAREIAEIRGPRPPSARELETAKAALTRGFPRSFETAARIARAGVQLALHDLPDDDYTQFVPRIQAVGSDDVLQAAARRLRPDDLAAVVVGSRPDVLDSLAGLGFGDPVERPPV